VMGTVIVASPTADFEARVRAVMNGALNGNLRSWMWPPDAPDPAQVARAIAADGPAVVALGPGIPGEIAVDVAAAIDRGWPDVTVIIVAEPTAELWSRALRAGARDLVSPGADDTELREAMERALDRARRRGSYSAAGAGAASDHRTVMVISPKGGVGKTTVSTNLATGLARLAPKEVVLVDLDLQFGDVADALRLTPAHTVVDACRTGAALDAIELKVFLTPHPAGFYVLCAPASPIDAEDVTDEHVDHVLATLAAEFRYVVIDTAAGITGPTLTAVRRATDLVLMCSTDVLTVRGMRKVVDALDTAGMTAQRRHFVLNRADARVGLTSGDIEAAVGMSVDVAVPSSRLVPLSTNQGQPLLENGDGSPAGRALLELVSRFGDAPARQAAGRWWRKQP
jgi:pilus assembly protein CpaE